MTNKELRELSGDELLKLYEEFVKWNHYEAVDEFSYLKEMGMTYYDIHIEIKRRMSVSGL